MKPRTHNQPAQSEQRRELRNNSTAAEVALWQMIKSRQIEGVKFRRQFSIGPYILDFYSPEIKLSIELDGANHYTESGSDNDYNRTEYLRNEHNIEVLRFENRALYNYPEEVLAEIRRVVKERKNIIKY
jgi:very-short-patch-repair endonuclease